MSSKKQGIIYILIAAFSFSLMTVFVRMSGDVPTMQKSFFRNLVAMMVAFVMVVKTGSGFKVRKGCLKYLIARSSFGVTGIICNFYAIDKLNISDANMLNKLSPFFAIIMSYFILKEKANKKEWLAVIIAFAGALFVMKPSFSMEALPAFIGALGGFTAGVAYTFVRKMGMLGQNKNFIVFFFSAFSCIVILPFMLMDFKPMTLQQTLLLLGAGCAAAGGQLGITAAYTKAPARDISVFDYSQIIFAAIWGFMFFGEVPDVLSFIGYAVIISAAVWRVMSADKNK